MENNRYKEKYNVNWSQFQRQLMTNYIKKLTKKVYFYAIDDTKPSTYG